MVIRCVTGEVFRVVCILMVHLNVRARVDLCDHYGSWIRVIEQHWILGRDCLDGLFLVVGEFLALVGRSLEPVSLCILRFALDHRFLFDSSGGVSLISSF
jgi:hypothetical protein